MRHLFFRFNCTLNYIHKRFNIKRNVTYAQKNNAPVEHVKVRNMLREDVSTLVMYIISQSMYNVTQNTHAILERNAG